MALTITSDLTVLTTAESYASPPWFNIGAQAAATEPDFYVQGNNAISRAVSGAVSKGMVYDNTTGIDFTTGTHKDKLVYIWMITNTPGLSATRSSAGVTVRLATGSATTNYRDWYVNGSDVFTATDGWICYVIDPQSAGSATSGSYSAANVRYFGGYLTTTTTAKGQNFGIDQIAYGRGEIYVSGTNATAGEGFKEIAATAYDSARSNRWGIITVKQGIYYVKGKIILGHSSTNTTFTSYNETVVFETPDYYDASGNTVKTIPDVSVGATTGADGLTTYNGLAIRGGAATISISFGVIAGTINGRSGSAFGCPVNTRLTTPDRTMASVVVDDSTMTLGLYGSTFSGFSSGVDLKGTGTSGDDCFNNTFDTCGRLTSNMKIRNCNILNSLAATTDGAYLWESTTDMSNCLLVNNSRAIVFESATGTPFTFTNMTFGSNTYDVRNESGSAITINYSGGTEPTKEEASGTVTVQSSVSLTIEIRDADGNLISSNCEVTVVRDSDTTILFAEDNITDGLTVYSYSTGAGTLTYINVHNVAGYLNRTVNNYSLPSSNTTLTIQLDDDRFYLNP